MHSAAVSQSTTSVFSLRRMSSPPLPDQLPNVVYGNSTHITIHTVVHTVEVQADRPCSERKGRAGCSAARLQHKAAVAKAAAPSFANEIGESIARSAAAKKAAARPSLVSFGERLEFARRAGVAAQLGFLGFRVAFVSKPLSHPQPRFYVVLRDNNNVTHRPALIFETWNATLPVVIDSAATLRSDTVPTLSRYAVFQGFATEAECQAYLQGAEWLA